MAFTGNYTCTVFKTGLLNGDFAFDTDTFKIALYDNTATLNADTTAYTTAGEITDVGYTAGGNTLTASVGTSGGISYVTFNNTSWTGAITARGALIYKSGSGDPAVCVLDFGSNKTSAANFTVQFPSPTNTSAIIRLT